MPSWIMTHGSLFTGIGGFDLGFESAGIKTLWQVEQHDYCTRVLEKHWPKVQRFRDVRECGAANLARVDIISGGDPCPIRSKAGSIHGRHKQEDYAPEFLRIAWELRPRWVVRENVPHPDAEDFAWALRALGYGVVIVEANSGQVTGQHRAREFVVGLLGTQARERDLAESFGVRGPRTPKLEAQTTAQALTTHRYRMDSRDNFIFEEGRGIRILGGEERERLQGFPPGWTDCGLSERARAFVLGNAVPVPATEWLGRRIVEAARRNATPAG